MIDTLERASVCYFLCLERTYFFFLSRQSISSNVSHYIYFHLFIVRPAREMRKLNDGAICLSHVLANVFVAFDEFRICHIYVVSAESYITTAGAFSAMFKRQNKMRGHFTRPRVTTRMFYVEPAHVT